MLYFLLYLDDQRYFLSSFHKNTINFISFATPSLTPLFVQFTMLVEPVENVKIENKIVAGTDSEVRYSLLHVSEK